MAEDMIAQLEAERKLDKLKAKVSDFTQQERDLNEQITKYELKIDALSDQAEIKRKEMNAAFRDQHKEKFKDLDIKRALVFGNARHVVALGTYAKFILSIPSGDMVHRVNEFAMKPDEVDDVKDVATAAAEKRAPKKYAVGTISQAENVLLVYLVGAQMETGPEQELDKVPLINKLMMIRAVPSQTTTRIADEALLMQAYLSSVLEIEMGN